MSKDIINDILDNNNKPEATVDGEKVIVNNKIKRLKSLKKGKKLQYTPDESKGVHKPIPTGRESVAGYSLSVGDNEYAKTKHKQVLKELKELKNKDRSGMSKNEERFKGNIPSSTGSHTYDDKDKTMSDLKDKDGDRYQGAASNVSRPGSASTTKEAVASAKAASNRNENKTRSKHKYNDLKDPGGYARKRAQFSNKLSDADKARSNKLLKSEAIDMLDDIIKAVNEVKTKKLKKSTMLSGGTESTAGTSAPVASAPSAISSLRSSLTNGINSTNGGGSSTPNTQASIGIRG